MHTRVLQILITKIAEKFCFDLYMYIIFVAQCVVYTATSICIEESFLCVHYNSALQHCVWYTQDNPTAGCPVSGHG